ncbi:MAG: hypothetical protein ABI583_07420 [Betaproteobacteria bacterium]
MMAEEGIVSIAAAVQKAARQMGVTERVGLPSESEVQLALKIYQRLFQADSQPQECRSLRQAAVEIMCLLDRFSPWLVGAVLDGSANRFSRIELEMILGDAKQLEMFLLNAGIHFDIHNRRSTSSQHKRTLTEVSFYELFLADVAVWISLFPHNAARVSRSANGLKHARLSEVEALLAA